MLGLTRQAGVSAKPEEVPPLRLYQLRDKSALVPQAEGREGMNNKRLYMAMFSDGWLKVGMASNIGARLRTATLRTPAFSPVQMSGIYQQIMNK